MVCQFPSHKRYWLLNLYEAWNGPSPLSTRAMIVLLKISKIRKSFLPWMLRRIPEVWRVFISIEISSCNPTLKFCSSYKKKSRYGSCFSHILYSWHYTHCYIIRRCCVAKAVARGEGERKEDHWKLKLNGDVSNNNFSTLNRVNRIKENISIKYLCEFMFTLRYPFPPK